MKPSRTSPKSAFGRLIVLFAFAILSFGSINAIAQTPTPTPVTLNVARQGHTATVLADGRVLVFGGDPAGATEATVEILDISGSSSTLISLTGVAPRTGHTATRLADGRVLIAGGSTDGVSVSSTVIIDPAGNASPGPNMSSARSGHTAVYFSGTNNVLFIGGDTTGTAEVLDVAAGTSQSTPSNLSTPRSGHSSILMIDGRVLVVGGDGLNTAEVFDGSAFTPAGNAMTLARAGALLRTLPDGKVQIIGGNNDGSMEVYDPSIDTIGAYAHVIPSTDYCVSLQTGVKASQTRAALFGSGNYGAPFDRTGAAIVELGTQALVIGGSATTAVTTLVSSAATVTTDKLDYAPGELATITGTGFGANETINIVIHEDPKPDAAHVERKLTTTSDPNGNFTISYQVEDHDLNLNFILNARGATSGSNAQTSFTDANPQALTISNSSVTVIQGSTANFGNLTLEVGGNGNSCSVTLSVSSGLPSGATPAWATNPLVTTGSNIATNFSIATTASTPVGTYTFTIVGQRASGCQGNGNIISNQITLIVTAGTVNTTTEVSPASATFGAASANLTATVSPASGSLVGNGSVTFTVKQGSTVIGAPVIDNSVVAGMASVSYPLPANQTAGPYTIEAAYTAGTGFNSSTGTGQLTIGTASQAITFGALADKTYGDADFTVSATSSSNLSVTFAASGACTVASSTVHITGAGSCEITASQAGDSNYSAATDVNRSFTINKANATVVVTPYDVTYDGQSHTATATITGVNSENGATVGSVNLSGTTHTDAGTYNDTWTFTGTANYNNIAATAITNKISQATQAINVTAAAPTTAAYGSKFTVTASGGNSANSVVITASGVCSGSGNGTAEITMTSGTGTCTVKYNQAGNNNYAAATEVTSNTAAEKASLTVTASSHTVTYGDAAPTVTPNFATFVSGDTAVNSFTAQPVCSTIYTAGSPVSGTYTTSCKDAASDKYSFNYVAGSVTVNKATAVCTISGFNGTYDGTAHGATGACTGIGGAQLSGLTLGDSFTNVPGGTANWSFVDADGNYNNDSGTAAIVITQASSSTVVTCPATVPYNSQLQTPCTVLVTGVGINLTPSANYTDNENVGTATASYIFDGDVNHTGSSDSKTFQIAAISLTVTGAVAQNKTYNGNNTATVSYDLVTLTGKIAGDEVLIDISDPGYSATFDDENVGNDKPVTVVGLKVSGADAGNYTVAQPSGLKANITKQQLTLVGAVPEDRPYDGTEIATVNFADAELQAPVSGDNVDFDALSYSATFASKNVGNNIVVTVSGVALTGGDAGNYDLVQPTGLKANITPANLTASVIGDPTKTYDGNTDATLNSGNFQILGVAPGEGFAITKVAGTYNNPNVPLANLVTVALTANDFEPANDDTLASNYSFPTIASGLGHITKAATTTTVTFEAGPYIYRGTAFTATASVTGAGNLSQSVTPVNYTGECTNVTSANGCTASAEYAGDDNHFGSPGTASITITPATPTVTVSFANSPIPYDGLGHAANVTVNGVSGVLTVPANGTVAVTYTKDSAPFVGTPTNAGNYTASAAFTSTNANYTNASSTEIANLTINKANATCSIGGYTGVYDAAAHGATGGCVGVMVEPLNGLSLGTSFTDAPGGTATWTFTDTTGNYNDSTGTVAIVINKANAVCTISGYQNVYDSVAHGATGSCAGVTADPNAAGSSLDLGETFTNVPGGTAHWAFTGGTNYNDQSGDVAIEISKADATIVVTDYEGVYDALPHGVSGTAKGVNDVDLSSDLDLGATYTNVPGGPVTWTFSGGTNYNDKSGTANVTITPAVANVSVTGYTGTYDAASHGATGSATGVGGVNLNSLLNLGNSFTSVPGGTANWTFNAGDANPNYQQKSGNVAITINKADPICTINGFTGIYDGNSHGASGTCRGVQNEILSGLNLGASFTDVPGGTAAWTFTDQTGNYNDKAATAAIVINKATPTMSITFGASPIIWDGAPHPATVTVTGVSGPLAIPANGSVAITYKQGSTVIASPPMQVGNYTASATFTSTNGNYNNAATSTNAALTINTAFCFNGFFAPVGGSVESGNGGSSLDPVKSFKLNSTIPFKFALYNLGCSGTPITAGIHTIRLIKAGNMVDPEAAIDATPTDSATSGNQFRLTGTEWHFNLDTKKTPGITAGTWLVEATLQDGSTKTVWISIKK